MRLAADRVAAALRRLDFAGAPVWQQAQQRLLARLAGGDGAAGGAGQGGTPDGAEEDGPADVQQLAAAVAAAEAAAPPVPLEEEGLPYVEPKPKVSCESVFQLTGCRGADPNRVPLAGLGRPLAHCLPAIICHPPYCRRWYPGLAT